MDEDTQSDSETQHITTLEFEGYSDDTFGEYGTTNEDHDNCASGKPIDWLIETAGASLLVTGQYDHRYEQATGWSIAVQAISGSGDDATPPPWNIRFIESQCPYSPRLAVDVPGDYSLTCLQAHGGDQ